MNKSDEKLKIVVFIILIFLEVFFAWKVFVNGSDSLDLMLIFGTAFLMLLLVKISDLKSIDFFGNKAEFQNQLNETKKQVEETKDKLKETNSKVNETKDKVEKLFLSTMSGPMYHNLRKLSDPPFGRYFMTNGLKRELYHLRDIGYIVISSKSQGAISKIPQEGEDLSIYVNVTDVGKEFIKQREIIER
jgi:hypothetical protein